MSTLASVVARACVGALAVGLAGCGATSAEPPPTVSFSMAIKVPAGGELHTCQVVRMPKSDVELFVGGGAYETTLGTHHFLLFRTAAEMPDVPLNQPVDCYEGDGLMQYERGYVSGGQLRQEGADFPPGLGLAFASEERLLLQGHFVNTSGAEQLAEVHVDLHQVAVSSIRERVGTFRFYDPFIYVPPAGKARAQMRCHVHHDVTLLTAGSHMHKRGKAYAAFLDAAGAAPAKDPFYTTDDWEHPVYYTGPLEVVAGSALRFQCDYDNELPTPLVQGLSANKNEMCMLSAFYVPEQAADEDDCVSMDLHGTGARTCAQTNSCLQLCPPGGEPHFEKADPTVGECFQQCIVDSCPNVTEALFPELLCLRGQCATECATYGALCSGCVAQKCKPQLDACQALACH